MGSMEITAGIFIDDSEIETHAVRAQGPGGQNVNKVSNAVQVRFDIRASSLPEAHKERLLTLRDRRITVGGVAVIKAQRFRSSEQNRADALRRLGELVARAAAVPRERTPRGPGAAARRRRLEEKRRRSLVKSMRRTVDL